MRPTCSCILGYDRAFGLLSTHKTISIARQTNCLRQVQVVTGSVTGTFIRRHHGLNFPLVRSRGRHRTAIRGCAGLTRGTTTQTTGRTTGTGGRSGWVTRSCLLRVKLRRVPTRIMAPDVGRLRRHMTRCLGRRHVSFRGVRRFTAPHHLTLLVSNLTSGRPSIGRSMGNPTGGVTRSTSNG